MGADTMAIEKGDEKNPTNNSRKTAVWKKR